MTSEEDMGVYGTGTKIRDPSKHNPHKLPLQKLHEEEICPVCDTKAMVLFPIADAVFCDKCMREVAEWKKKYFIVRPFINIAHPQFCFKCGEPVSVGWKVSTRVCLKCLERAGNYEMAWRTRKYARRVA